MPLPDLFKPLWEYTPRDVNDKLSSLWARGLVALLLSSCCWALLVMGPDAKTVKSSVQDAQDSVLRYFVSTWVNLADVVLCKLSCVERVVGWPVGSCASAVEACLCSACYPW